MPKMSHAIEGWARASTLHYPVRTSPVRIHRPTGLPDRPGLWKYPRAVRSRWAVVFPVVVSVGLHALALLGFNHRAPPVRPTLVDDGPLIQMTMPDIEEDEEKPVESLGEEEPEPSPGITVPMLADLPTLVPVNAFIQPLDFTPTLDADPNAVRLSAIPVNIARGSGTAERIGKIFDVSQLDRQPQAIVQPPPVFPAELRRDYPTCTVVVGFIISAKGEVLSPYIISAEVRRFEPAALAGVLRWKFRPGYKAGRPVNTRIQIAIHFRTTGEE